MYKPPLIVEVSAHAYDSLLLPGKTPAPQCEYTHCNDSVAAILSQHTVTQDCMQMDPQAVQQMELLGQQAVAWQCVSHAESIAAEQESQEGIAQATSSLSLQRNSTEQTRQQHQYMVDNLDQWASFIGASGKDAHLTPIPPALQQLAVRPFMLDNALNYLAAPSIDHRVAKQEQPKSAFAKLFTWNKK